MSFVMPADHSGIAPRGGQVIGAVGVTGDTSDNDELAALAGAAAAGTDAQ